MTSSRATRRTKLAVMETAPPRKPKRHLATWLVPITLALACLVYVSLGLTPSSYGVLLTQLGAPQSGPVLGTPRAIRADEWALITPLFQAAVRNDFREINETSFYREDLRSVFPIPLRNWSLLFRPQLWAFFVTGPATAYSIYYAFLFCAFLSGYYLLFRGIGADRFMAAAVSVMIFFCGFVQFWGLWTLAGVPWLLLLILKPIVWWRKAVLLVWLMPATTMAHPYPPIFINLAAASLLLVLALRREWFRTPREIAAVAIGALATAAILYAYFGKLIPVMANTVYPGHRIAPSGTVPGAAVLSQILPFVAIHLDTFDNLTGLNVVEIGTLGTLLPLLTLCVTRFRDFWRSRSVRNSVFILLSGAAAMTLWQVAPVPHWIGRILLWDIAIPERLFPATGLLLIFASALVWRSQLVELSPVRIMIFFVVGSLGALVLKLTLFPIGLSACTLDLWICGWVLAGCLLACFLQPLGRAAVLLTLIAITNVLAFARFNPVQPAKAIFDLPETPLLAGLRRLEASTPEHVLVVPQFFGATLNGLGFRSVSHVLPTPQLAFFRNYFPTMDAARFNFVFNRYAHIQLTGDPLPTSVHADAVRVPASAFEPLRNLRQVSFSSIDKSACSAPLGGAIERSIAQGAQLTLEGWAPWKGETATQNIRVMSARRVTQQALVTVRRPDIAEMMYDYGYARAGFRLQLVSSDDRPLQRDEIALIAIGTAQGDLRLGGAGCP